MSVSQRKNGRWAVKYKTRDGWKQKTFPPSCEVEARQFDADCQYDAADNCRMTVVEAVLAYLKAVPHADRTVGLYEMLVLGTDRKNGRHFSGPAEHLADRYTDTLTRRDLESVRDICRDRHIAPATINLYVSKIKAALNWCAEQDLIASNPWGKYRQLPATHKSRKGELEDFRLIYEAMPEWMQWACRTTMALCLRPGLSELFSLRWSAFDWRQKTVSVWMPKVQRTKTVFPPNAYLAEAWERYQTDTAKGEQLVCRSATGRELRAMSVWRRGWCRACEKVGKVMPPYAMRHIAASEMLAGGADLAAVSAQLGHKSLQTTASFYTHALTRAQRQAAESIPTCTNLVRIGADIEKQPFDIP